MHHLTKSMVMFIPSHIGCHTLKECVRSSIYFPCSVNILRLYMYCNCNFKWFHLVKILLQILATPSKDFAEQVLQVVLSLFLYYSCDPLWRIWEYSICGVIIWNGLTDWTSEFKSTHPVWKFSPNLAGVASLCGSFPTSYSIWKSHSPWERLILHRQCVNRVANYSIH